MHKNMKNVVYLGTPGIVLYNVRAKTQSLIVSLLDLSWEPSCQLFEHFLLCLSSYFHP